MKSYKKVLAAAIAAIALAANGIAYAGDIPDEQFVISNPATRICGRQQTGLWQSRVLLSWGHLVQGTMQKKDKVLVRINIAQSSYEANAFPCLAVLHHPKTQMKEGRFPHSFTRPSIRV